jgi:hypothetical protein
MKRIDLDTFNQGTMTVDLPDRSVEMFIGEVRQSTVGTLYQTLCFLALPHETAIVLDLKTKDCYMVSARLLAKYKFVKEYE